MGPPFPWLPRTTGRRIVQVNTLNAKAVPLHATKALGGEEVYLLLILDLDTRWGWVVSVTPWPRFSPGERTPGTHCTGGWVGPRLQTDSRQQPNVDSIRPNRKHHYSLVCTFCYQSRNLQNWFQFFFIALKALSYSQAWRTLAIIFGIDGLALYTGYVKRCSSRRWSIDSGITTRCWSC
jgi:hypothetical protein